IWQLLADLAAADGSTVVMVTHEPAAAVHCRRVFMLRDGRITETFDVEDLDAAELATRAQHARS
ncbi:MAG: ABC transporter ATP-binding protein, partial [Phycisphaerales bacterium]|nr:ABC transporter ATP-binding protein [Phycisphaerales bacterium]